MSFDRLPDMVLFLHHLPGQECHCECALVTDQAEAWPEAMSMV